MDISDVLSRSMQDARYALRTYGNAKDKQEEAWYHANRLVEGEGTDEDWVRLYTIADNLKAEAGSFRDNDVLPDEVAEDLEKRAYRITMEVNQRNIEQVRHAITGYYNLLDSSEVIYEIIKYIRRPAVKGMKEKVVD